MSIAQLHDIPNFTELFTDPRFIGLLMYLRKNRPKATQREAHGIIQDCGRIDAYLDLIDKMEEAQRLPEARAQMEPRIPYNSTQSLDQNR